MVYELDATLKPITHYYLGDPEEIAQAAAAVAAQGKAKWFCWVGVAECRRLKRQLSRAKGP